MPCYTYVNFKSNSHQVSISCLETINRLLRQFFFAGHRIAASAMDQLCQGYLCFHLSSHGFVLVFYFYFYFIFIIIIMVIVFVLLVVVGLLLLICVISFKFIR